MGLSAEDSIPKKKGILHGLYEFVKEFSRVDTNYVEPQHYNFTVMAQNTNTYEIYRITSKSGQQITFAPKPAVKIGPYFGWRWIFLGYTIDLTHLGDKGKKQDINLSLYSNQIGLDFFYRKTGDDYKIRKINLGEGTDMSSMKDVSFDGFKGSIKGFNLYYIFNHRKFSYPAAYSQSTVQRRSAGSALAGIGYTKHSIDIDWDKLKDVVTEYKGQEFAENHLDSTLQYVHSQYTDISLSGGYAYNWVFAHNWLLDVSASLALCYDYSKGESEKQKSLFEDFSFKDINLNGTFRLGIVWNNTKWYAGANAIMHAYNYRKSQFYTNNTFGSVNIYFGFNFNRR